MRNERRRCHFNEIQNQRQLMQRTAIAQAQRRAQAFGALEDELSDRNEVHRVQSRGKIRKL